LALMSELVTSNQRGNRMLLGAPVRDRGAFGQRTLAAPGATADDEDNVDQLRRETEALKLKLAEYERAAAVVAMAAQKGASELKQQQQQVITKVKGGKQQQQLREIQSETDEE